MKIQFTNILWLFTFTLLFASSMAKVLTVDSYHVRVFEVCLASICFGLLLLSHYGWMSTHGEAKDISYLPKDRIFEVLLSGTENEAKGGQQGSYYAVISLENNILFIDGIIMSKPPVPGYLYKRLTATEIVSAKQ